MKNLIKQRQRLREHFQKEAIFDFSDKEITSIDKEFLKKATKIIENHLADSLFGVDQFAEELFMSRQQLRRKLLSIVGESPSELTRKVRLTRAAKLIEQNFGNISEIALEVGFSSPANFTKAFRKQFSLSPSEYELKFTSKKR